MHPSPVAGGPWGLLPCQINTFGSCVWPAPHSPLQMGEQRPPKPHGPDSGPVRLLTVMLKDVEENESSLAFVFSFQAVQTKLAFREHGSLFRFHCFLGYQ